MKVQRCKGTKDLSPQEMRLFRLIEGTFRDCCLKWGYEEVRTPTLEYLHLFTATGTLTPSRLDRVYSFLDWDGWSGERVVLRPDGTIPIARLYVDSMAERELAKLFYVTNVFTFEGTGKETREKWQCGAELIGAGSAVADVELIMLALEVLRKLGLTNLELGLSHAGLIRGLLTQSGLSTDEQHKLFDQVLDGEISGLTKGKLGKSGLAEALTYLLDLKGKSAGFLKNVKALLLKNSPQLGPALNNFIAIADLLETLGVDYQIDITSGRGFEYYTGVMFRILTNGKHIGAGGRYDNLIPLMGGKDIPASGFALYLDYLMSLIKPEASAMPQAQGILIKSRAKEAAIIKEAFNLAGILHEAGYAAEMDLGGQEPANLRWQIDIKDKAPKFVLTDMANRRKFTAKTYKDVLKLLNGE